MSDRHADNPNERSCLSLGALLRCASDGELSDAERRRLEEHLREHPEDEARIEHERRLREACARVMTDVNAPPELRARLEETLTRRADDEELLDRIEAMARRTRARGFWQRVPPSVKAAAAAILLVMGAIVLFYAPGSPLAPRGFEAQLVQFLDSEHERCRVDPGYVAQKMTVTRLEHVPQAFGEVLGTDVSLGTLYTAGFEFLGAGQCKVPGGGRSMHLTFRTPPAPDHPPSTFSLFVQEPSPELRFQAGVTYRLTSDSWFSDSDCSIYAWVRDGLVYYLVSTNERACGLGREALDAPAKLQDL